LGEAGGVVDIGISWLIAVGMEHHSEVENMDFGDSIDYIGVPELAHAGSEN